MTKISEYLCLTEFTNSYIFRLMKTILFEISKDLTALYFVAVNIVLRTRRTPRA
jgi:hypothetical protein